MMRRAKLAAAAAAATAAGLAVPAQAPAAAAPDPCFEDPTVPACVNWTFDTVERLVTQPPPLPDTGRVVDDAVCVTHYLITGRECPR